MLIFFSDTVYTSVRENRIIAKQISLRFVKKGYPDLFSNIWSKYKKPRKVNQLVLPYYSTAASSPCFHKFVSVTYLKRRTDRASLGY